MFKYIEYIEQPNLVLDNIRKHLDLGSELIPINYTFYPTKGQPGKSQGYLYRDKKLEDSVKKL